MNDTLEATKNALGEVAYDLAYAEGAAMTPEQVAALAMTDELPDSSVHRY